MGPWFGLSAEPASGGVDLVVFGVPYDRSVFFRRGAADGPARIRSLSDKLTPSSERGASLEGLRIAYLGDVAPTGDELLEALHEDIEETWLRARRLGLPLALGGDHSITIPLFAAAAKHAPDGYGILWIDAHPDLCDCYQGSRNSHACVLRRGLDHSQVRPENVIMLGPRSFETEEIEAIRHHSLTLLTSEELARRDARDVAAMILDRIGGVPVYLSIDVDGFDPAFAPGTGIPDAGGLSTRWVLDLLHALHPLLLLGVDIVEVAPALDVPSDATSLLALKLILEILDTFCRRPSTA
jgi:agmatinase